MRFTRLSFGVRRERIEALLKPSSARPEQDYLEAERAIVAQATRRVSNAIAESRGIATGWPFAAGTASGAEWHYAPLAPKQVYATLLTTDRVEYLRGAQRETSRTEQ